MKSPICTARKAEKPPHWSAACYQEDILSTAQAEQAALDILTRNAARLYHLAM